MKYICSICGYIFDEEKEGTSFSSLPETWVCPLCKAPKSAFQPEVKKQSTPAPAVRSEEKMQELSVGELSALFSNLARGCEKQYKAKEAENYLKIAKYFDRIAPAADPQTIEDLADKIASNLEGEYPELEAIAANCKDRGALRAYTWGLKVTRMQQAIVSQYLQNGEAFLEHTRVWVCTVCGFIYIGDNPPALCPVCKVPDWKFEEIQGGALA